MQEKDGKLKPDYGYFKRSILFIKSIENKIKFQEKKGNVWQNK